MPLSTVIFRVKRLESPRSRRACAEPRRRPLVSHPPHARRPAPARRSAAGLPRVRGGGRGAARSRAGGRIDPTPSSRLRDAVDDELEARTSAAARRESRCVILGARVRAYLRSLNPELPRPVWLLQVGGADQRVRERDRPAVLDHLPAQRARDPARPRRARGSGQLRGGGSRRASSQAPSRTGSAPKRVLVGALIGMAVAISALPAHRRRRGRPSHSTSCSARAAARSGRASRAC